MVRDLATTVRTLHASGICAGARLTSDGRLQVWLGDTARGIRDAAFFRFFEFPRAADWLAASALRHYPRSDYARVWRMLARAAEAARS